MRSISHIIENFSRNKIFSVVTSLSAQLKTDAYVVGGYVRDQFLERPSKDIDFVVVGDGVKFAEAFAEELNVRSKLVVFKNFGTANVKVNRFEIEFVGARKESYSRDSRKPKTESGTLLEDLSRRDFTINAMAISLNNYDYGCLIDIFGGVDDLHAGIIRTPLEPDKTYDDDPLRMMRAIRFASQLDFQLEKNTFESITRNNKRLQIISYERISDELNKIILSEIPSRGFLLLHESGLLDYILPELIDLKGTETVDNKSHKDNFYHTLKVLDNMAEVTDNLWLRWAAILHDIGKPATKYFDNEAGWTFHGHEFVGSKMVTQVFRRLRLPMNEKMKYVKKLVYLHLRPVALTKADITDSAIRRLIVDAGEDINDLLMLCKADITSKHQDRVRQYSKRFDMVSGKINDVTEKDKLRNWKNPISGELIMKTFGLKPSKQVGQIKDAVKEAILEGIIANDYDAAYQYMLQIASEMKLNKS